MLAKSNTIFPKRFISICPYGLYPQLYESKTRKFKGTGDKYKKKINEKLQNKSKKIPPPQNTLFQAVTNATTKRMVELSEGKKKLIDGTVVDADDLIEKMVANALAEFATK